MPNLERLMEIPKNKRVIKIWDPKNITTFLPAREIEKEIIEAEIEVEAPKGANFYKIGSPTDTLICDQGGDYIKKTYPVVYIKLE